MISKVLGLLAFAALQASAQEKPEPKLITARSYHWVQVFIVAAGVAAQTPTARTFGREASPQIINAIGPINNAQIDLDIRMLHKTHQEWLANKKIYDQMSSARNGLLPNFPLLLNLMNKLNNLEDSMRARLFELHFRGGLSKKEVEERAIVILGEKAGSDIPTWPLSNKQWNQPPTYPIGPQSNWTPRCSTRGFVLSAA